MTDEEWHQRELENRRLAEELGFDPKKWGTEDWMKKFYKEKENGDLQRTGKD